MKNIKCFLIILLVLNAVCLKAQNPLWNNKQCAVVLTYDDAINVDLDNVIPALDSLKLKATFYLIGSSPVVKLRMDEWRKAAANGHELGNHSLFHPCDGSLPGRGFVTPETDLSKYSTARAINEIKLTNTLLKAIDGKEKRTFAYPCGDITINGEKFYDGLKGDFSGARGVKEGLQTAKQVDLADINAYAINGQSAAYMIGLVEQARRTNTLLVFIFHGVGGGHNIDVGLNEHSKLLHYLKNNEKDIWVITMLDAAEYIRKQNVSK